MKNFWGFGPWKKSKKDSELKGKPRFAGFALLERLGKGGFGEVFYAIKTDNYETGEYVALKKLQESQDDQEKLRFQREIRILFNLNHPNVVKVLEYGEEENVCFYTMEILQGENLGDRLAQGTLSVEQTVSLIKQVAGGLHAVHEQGIVHRDVKPENIFLCEDGQAKLIDFGLAKDPTDAVKITLQGTAGSILYMPPEVMPVLHGSQDFDLKPAYDQFALAAIAFEALTGERPFKAQSGATSTLASIMFTELKSLEEFDIPNGKALDGPLHKALSPKISDRFETIVDFAEALEKAAI